MGNNSPGGGDLGWGGFKLSNGEGCALLDGGDTSHQ
jgi:hypothetical protein